MTQDEIIEMARQAGWHEGGARSAADALKAFAEILAARLVPQEREACARVCEDFDFEFQDDSAGTLQGAAEAIRAREQA